MFRYNLKANYQPNGGRYLQILSGKDLYKQTIVVSAMKNDGVPWDQREVNSPFLSFLYWGFCGSKRVKSLSSVT